MLNDIHSCRGELNSFEREVGPSFFTDVVIIQADLRRIDIRVHHVSHETFGAQFLIGRARGQGGRWLS